MTESFYFDTYALVEIAQSKQSYDKYRSDVLIMTNKLNIAELAYFLLRIGREDKIVMVFNDYLRYNVEPSTNALIEAVKLKFAHKKKKLSYVDCLGYVIAMENKVKFLTGDEKFRNMENVEFVK